MKTQNINMRIDPQTKLKAEQIYAQFGITLSDAINIFLNKSIMVGGLPFELVPPKYNQDTINAVNIADAEIADGKVFTHNEVFSDLKSRANAIKAAGK